MGNCVVQVWFESEPEIAVRPALFVMVETEFDDFASFCEAVDADQFIGGAVLWTRREPERRVQIVVDRQPCAFRGSAVRRCQLPRWRFEEVEE